MEFVTEVAHVAQGVLELAGIIIIVAQAACSLAYAVALRLKRHQGKHIFDIWRVELGRGILLGLEFLVAADIIATVAVEYSIESVGVLAAVILIRTFLSFTLEVEMSGRWPWQQSGNRE